MRRAVAGISTMAILAFGCQQPSPQTPGPETPFFGRVSYRVVVDAWQTQGVFIIDPDNTVIEPQDEDCRRLSVSKTHREYSWICTSGGEYSTVVISLDIGKPVPVGSWRATHTVQHQRQVCTSYVTNPKGEQICTKFGPETYEVPETKSGKVIIEPVHG